MSFKVGIVFLFAGFFLASAPVEGAEPVSIESSPAALPVQALAPVLNPQAGLGLPAAGEIPASVILEEPAVAAGQAAVATEQPVAFEPPVAAHEAALGRAEIQPAPRAARPVIVIEAPRRTSFELLRRESYLYPDHDLGSRFLETGTGVKPLFGEDF